MLDTIRRLVRARVVVVLQALNVNAWATSSSLMCLFLTLRLDPDVSGLHAVASDRHLQVLVWDRRISSASISLANRVLRGSSMCPARGQKLPGRAVSTLVAQRARRLCQCNLRVGHQLKYRVSELVGT